MIHYLCKLLTCVHQICTGGMSDVGTPIARFIPIWTYVSEVTVVKI